MKKPALQFFVYLLVFSLCQTAHSQDNSIKSFTQNFDKKEGFLNYYWDDTKGKVYLEIENLNEEMIYVNYLSAGVGSNDIGLDRGQIGGTRIIKFIKIGPKILMVQPKTILTLFSGLVCQSQAYRSKDKVRATEGHKQRMKCKIRLKLS